MTSEIPEQTFKHLRQERDRHVAFAFAAADLLIEVSSAGTVIAASGAAQAVLDAGTKALLGQPIVELVAPGDRLLVRQLLKQVQVSLRIDPAIVRITRSDGTSSPVLLGGCRLPDRSDVLFITITLVPDALVEPTQERDAGTGLLSQDAFNAAAQRLGSDPARGSRRLELIRLDGLSGAARQLPPERASALLEEIGAALRAASVGGDAAGRLGEDAFGIVTKAGHRGQRNTTLASDIAEAISEAGIPEGQVASRIASIALSFGDLTNDEASRALSYALNNFVKSQGSDFDVASLESGLTKAMNQAVTRFADTRKILADGRFMLVYQPVVDLATRAVHHYEALSRFPDGANTFETVTFSEDLGLIIELDLIVCRRAVEAIMRSDKASVAVNVSGRSVQNEAFRKALLDVAARLGSARHQLMFELTESAAVDNLAEAEEFLARLRAAGHAICLDDFGAGATAYNYMRQFSVDFVKIDGPFLKAANDRNRERALIRSICVLCDELGCKVIGEMIEDETEAVFAKKLGIAHGQGWLFGKPIERLPAGEPIEQLPPARRSMRRRGSTETWQ
jgi:EAL domain-containing protein (putative c-di-GMP-specific phosphodiesterase class I)/GGDEF domain-containing protein